MTDDLDSINSPIFCVFLKRALDKDIESIINRLIEKIVVNGPITSS